MELGQSKLVPKDRPMFRTLVLVEETKWSRGFAFRTFRDDVCLQHLSSQYPNNPSICSDL